MKLINYHRRSNPHHLDANETQDEGHRVPQVVELLDATGEQQVERAQREQREGVGGVDDEGVLRDAYHCRDRVDGEDDVRELDAH